jgi:hypothetical protein
LREIRKELYRELQQCSSGFELSLEKVDFEQNSGENRSSRLYLPRRRQAGNTTTNENPT